MVNDSLASGEPARLAIALDQDIQSAPTVQEPLGQNISISNDGLPMVFPRTRPSSWRPCSTRARFPSTCR